MSVRRKPTEEQKRRMKELMAVESKPEVIEATRNQVRNLRKSAAARQTLAQRTLQLLLEEKERQGVSLAQLEERCQITRGNLSKLWNDPDPNATLNTIERIATALNVQLSVTVSR